MKAHFLIQSILSLTFLFSIQTWSRPDYALKTTTVSCKVCHVNPFGGGARTIFGKAYGSFGLAVAPYSKQDLFSGDLRAVAYFPQSSRTKVSGFSLMNVQGTLNAPITDENQTGLKTNLVVNFTSPELNAEAGESFILIEPHHKIQIVLGKFVRPFGLLTDEHRTFVRMQTNSSIRDYESGIGFSHEVLNTLHIDLTYTNEPISSKLIQEPVWDSLVNVRWTPYAMPIMLGASASSHQRPNEKDSHAQSVYGGFSFDRATQFSVPMTLTLEASRAKGWTSKMNRLSNFINSATDSAFKDSIVDKTSLGFYSQLMWNYRPHIAFLYKFDQLLFDEKYPADAFERHAFGTNWNLNSNLIFQARVEYAKNGRKDVDQSVKSSIDALYFVVRAWL